MSVEVMRQALEALELALSSHGVMLLSDPPQDAWKTRQVENKGREAVTALRTAIEQAKEPVAWMYTSHWKGNERYITRYQTDLTTYKADKVWPLYTAPCQWVGLTDEDVQQGKTESWVSEQAFESAVWWAETKLKEKNT
jgi:hypothetical protein